MKRGRDIFTKIYVFNNIYENHPIIDGYFVILMVFFN